MVLESHKTKWLECRQKSDIAGIAVDNVFDKVMAGQAVTGGDITAVQTNQSRLEAAYACGQAWNAAVRDHASRVRVNPEVLERISAVWAVEMEAVRKR
jgi:hypothetical protein